ncbi:hypothetical protein DFH09DRAFT_1389985 [Mycena vulgaris]|nr:hypothetical protein DFH09DRAFT_1389985 [Mycena vulgaris]
MDDTISNDDMDQSYETDWIPTKWIGCGKKYRDIPPIVDTARRTILKIAQFLLFELPLLGDPTPNKLEPRRAIVSLGLPELVEQLFHYAVTWNRKEHWIRAASWLENTGQTMEELGLKRTVKGLWKTIAWYGSLRGFACIAVADLATFFSQDYFGGNLVDGMMDLLSIRLAESGGQ